MMDGAWLHEKRGQIAFNWPTNPKILHMLPGLAQYYYNSMIDNDYFTVPTSGIGYFVLNSNAIFVELSFLL